MHAPRGSFIRRADEDDVSSGRKVDINFTSVESVAKRRKVKK
jgi:hypothetical protein